MYTDEERVEALLSAAGVSADPSLIAAAIDDASFIVQQYNFKMRGTASEAATGTLKDATARFNGYVEAGAVVINATKRDAGEATYQTTIKKVESNISLTLLSETFTCLKSDRYEIEDLKRYELAERYKAASFVASQTEALTANAGGSSERLGPIAVTTGNFGGVASSASPPTNTFESMFQRIVGVPMAAV